MNTSSEQHGNGSTWSQQDGGSASRIGTRGAASEKPGPGRPSTCTPLAMGMLPGVIRETGISDSAAAVRLGFGASTLSRWKREDPEVRVYLEQAREECRALQLQKITEAAAAENGRGWRAAAWLLERLFPQDYAMNAGVREGHRQVAEAQSVREERAYEEADQESARRKRAEAATARACGQDVIIPMPPQESRELPRADDHSTPLPEPISHPTAAPSLPRPGTSAPAPHVVEHAPPCRETPSVSSPDPEGNMAECSPALEGVGWASPDTSILGSVDADGRWNAHDFTQGPLAEIAVIQSQDRKTHPFRRPLQPPNT